MSSSVAGFAVMVGVLALAAVIRLFPSRPRLRGNPAQVIARASVALGLLTLVAAVAVAIVIVNGTPVP